jgi:2-oxoisovalerate dehydrogenase E2 component (dihydrolipoyl transacylase)
MQFKLPELGEGVYEGEVVRWNVKEGEAVKPGQTLLEVLTDKATMEVPAPFAGSIEKLLVQPGDKIDVGQPILDYQGKASGKAEEKEDKKVELKEEKPAKHKSVLSRSEPAARQNGEAPAKRVDKITSNGPFKAAPSVRQLARKLGVDLAKIRGSGPDGRILIDDLSAQLAAEPKTAAPVLPSADFGKPGTTIKFAGVRRKIAEHMVQAKHLIPHYAYVDDCDVSDLVKLRASLKEAFADKGVKLTYLAFFVKAVVAALKEVPIVNASLNEEAGEIVLHDRYHIGIAVATPMGLIVPVIHDADQKSLIEVAKDIERLTEDARAGKAKLEDLKGGTFTITSIGNLGGLFSAPIVNYPEVGILGVGKIVKRPVFDEHGQVKPAEMVYLSFSFDHRVLDGSVGAAFGNAIMKRLQNPALLLID